MEWRWDGQEHNITIFHGRRIFGDKIWDGLHAFVGALKVACHTASFFHGLVPPFCFIRIQRNSSDFVATAKQARHHLCGIATTTPEASMFKDVSFEQQVCFSRRFSTNMVTELRFQTEVHTPSQKPWRRVWWRARVCNVFAVSHGNSGENSVLDSE